ncbi:amidase family protein [Microbacterium trichothecenolyticum]|uniref:Amidase n=1 Tax=Microbacterium trichothecenolyticum TaxID=69370 RepID=A0ABU0TSE4_MICTR|nr:amidase family protein [Microbacterium trichothecenolyticum]MDQ1122587.1 amidase [Microbacterium trichothecenolyticum]
MIARASAALTITTKGRSVKTGAMITTTLAALVSAALLLGTAAPAQASDTSVGYLAPDFQRGELTGDHKIDEDDLSLLMAALGRQTGEPGWVVVAPADADRDGVITVFDVAALSRQYVYDDDTFELLEADVVSMQKAMTAGVLTSQQLTAEYLRRIAAYDRTEGLDSREPKAALESLIATNPTAMAEAAALDAERAATGPRSILHGIPVIAKDNINLAGIATTSGCGCLRDNVTATDATTIQRLRSMGAIVIAKANLSEFAESTIFSTSAYGTTRNAYNLAYIPGGSSGGTGASISANLGAVGLGTDTGGSVRVPSSFNSLVGIRPTVGLVSREGVFPLDEYRDTVGPMTRTVSDAALTLDALAGSDPADPVTASADARKPDSYARALDPLALRGARLGYLSDRGPDDAQAGDFQLVAAARADLEAAGATVVDIGELGPINGGALEQVHGSRSFAHDADVYLDTFYKPGYTFADLAQKVTDAEKAGTPISSLPASTVREWASTTPEERQEYTAMFLAGQKALQERLDQLMQQNDLDALIYPSTGDRDPELLAGYNNFLSAFSGYPAVSVPMGYADIVVSQGTIPDFPRGLEFLAEPYAEEKLIGLAYAYEQQTHHRRQTALFPDLP